MSQSRMEPRQDETDLAAEQTTPADSKRRKLRLICVVCDGNAHGYNFDAISCESCKAFFRRNALQPLDKFKCRGDGHCNVSGDQRRRCKKCRLEKCFQTGMRKEWILTEKEKEAKRLKISENRHLRRLQDARVVGPQRFLTADDFRRNNQRDTSAMSASDWLKLDSVLQKYSAAIQLNKPSGISQFPSVQPIESTLELFSVPLYLASMRLITYFKQIPEFQQLTRDDQVHLVKLNSLSIVFLHSLLIYDSKTNVYHELESNDPLFLERDWINTLTEDFHREMKGIYHDLIGLIPSDGKILKLFFLLALFSDAFAGSSSNVNCHSLEIFHIQNVYNDLLYRYCLRCYGLINSSKLYLRLISKLMHIQRLVQDIQQKIHQWIDTTQLPALMQSLL